MTTPNIPEQSSEYPDVWVKGLPLPYGPPLPTGEVNLRTGERRLYNPVRPSLSVCGQARPDELAELRAKYEAEPPTIATLPTEQSRDGLLACPLVIVFDGPPGPEAGRFVECETPDGRSINAGEWRDRGDGLWELRVSAAALSRPSLEPSDANAIATAPKTPDDLSVTHSILGWCPDATAPNDGDWRVVWWEPKMNGGCWYGDRDLVEHPTAWFPLPQPIAALQHGEGQ